MYENKKIIVEYKVTRYVNIRILNNNKVGEKLPSPNALKKSLFDISLESRILTCSVPLSNHNIYAQNKNWVRSNDMFDGTCDGIQSQYLYEFNKLAIIKDVTNGVPFHE